MNHLAFKRKRIVGRPRHIGPALIKSPPRLWVEPTYIFTGKEETEIEVMDWEKKVDGIDAFMMEPSR